jgi:hypothetical protein
MGKIPWKLFLEVPRDAIYNMDKVGNDTTKNRFKGIADVETMACMFQLTLEGDGKMNIHITTCITTCANGKLLVDWWGRPSLGAVGFFSFLFLSLFLLSKVSLQ